MSYQHDDIKALVRQVVARTLGDSQGASSASKREILDAETVRQLPFNSVHHISPNVLVTPLARQVAMERKINLSVSGAEADESRNLSTHAAAPLRAGGQKHKIALGADHGGFQLKEQLKEFLGASEPGYQLIDCGTYSTEAVDYPDLAYAVARLVASGEACRGIIIDGAGIGSCMAANKVPGVRAAMCYDQATAVNSREHNNANVLTLGAGLIGPNLAKQIVTSWLATEFGGGRHARRVDKIDQIGERFSKR